MEWDEQEQAWMLALKAYRDTRCPGCNGNLTVTTAQENEDRYRHELPLECYRCQGFARSHKAQESHPYPLSLIHLVPQRPS